MLKQKAVIKLPAAQAEDIRTQLAALGVSETETETVPFETFIEESRLNYDCVYGEAFEEGKDVVYLSFDFEDSEAGRAAAFRVEYGLKQIPLNLRYCEA